MVTLMDEFKNFEKICAEYKKAHKNSELCLYAIGQIIVINKTLGNKAIKQTIVDLLNKLEK